MEVGVNSPEHALVLALTLLSAESPGIEVSLGASMGLIGVL